MQIEVGQIYTFNKSKTYDVINYVEKGKTKREDKIWYLIFQIGDLDYFDRKLNRSIIWSRAMPNNEGTCMDIEYMYRFEFEELFNKQGKFIGVMNKDFGLNDRWNLVKKDIATKDWEPMMDNMYEPITRMEVQK